MISLNFIQGFSDQKLDAVLDAYPVTLRARWNERFSFWSLGIYDRESVPLITGIKLVRDYPLLSRLEITEFTGDLYFIRLNGNKERPDFNSLGGDHILIYATEEEIDELVSANG